MVWLPRGEKIEDIFVSRESTNVTDRQTNGLHRIGHTVHSIA